MTLVGIGVEDVEVKAIAVEGTIDDGTGATSIVLSMVEIDKDNELEERNEI